MIRRLAEGGRGADAPARLDKEGPAITLSAVTDYPPVTGSPLGTGEAPWRPPCGASPWVHS
jgi:hypothetical protein